MENRLKPVIICVLIALVLASISTAVVAAPTDPVDPDVKFDAEKLFVGVVSVIKWVVRLGALAVVGAFIWLGFKLMRSAGNPKNRAEAMEGFQYVIYGAVAIFGAFFLQTGLQQLVNWLFTGKGP
jgi:hypothetical protein